MNILLISELKKGSGNLHTIERIRAYLLETGNNCTLLPSEHFTNEAELKHYVAQHKIQLVIGLHALKSGRLLQDSTIPFLVIIGGTDINQYYTDRDSFKLMTNSVTHAKKVITFSRGNLNRVKELWPELPTNKIFIIKQAVQTSPSGFSLSDYIRIHHPDIYRDDMAVCICVGSIRPVKNPLYLVDAFSELHGQDSRVVFVLLGHVVEKEYGDIFLSKIKSLPGVIFIPGLPLQDTHAAIQQSFAYINSSESEGMSLAILEAMLLRTPVIARNIPGNLDIITDRVTGLVYSNPKECTNNVEQLLSKEDKRNSLIESAANYVVTEHCINEEKRHYINAVTTCA